jgi:ATP-binding cassette subfamily B protein/subfamily B ATP-binding cassette protein MsbA
MELLGVLSIAGALLVGAYIVLNNETGIWGLNFTDDKFETASLMQLYALLAAIADPVRKLSNVYTRLQSAAAASDRIFAFMDRESKVRSLPGAPRLERHHRSVEFRDVCFSYTPDQPILTNIHLHVRAGEVLGLVGKNGCGKTTLVGLLARFYDPDHGSVFIDGYDLRKVHLRSLRQQIGLVTQETVLFDDSIYNNIAYGNRHANREEVEEAAKSAYAHDFILKLKNGYETRVGEMGAALSGGQRQRIALARAILRDPSILILDEATSAADVESESLIHKALADFTTNRTTFIITHRLSTLEIVDRILVMDSGRIEAVGTHEELMRACPTYQRLCEMDLQRKVA